MVRIIFLFKPSTWREELSYQRSQDWWGQIERRMLHAPVKMASSLRFNLQISFHLNIFCSSTEVVNTVPPFMQLNGMLDLMALGEP